MRRWKTFAGLAVLLTAAFTPARAQSLSECPATIEAYEKAPTVAHARPLFPCFNHPDPKVRGRAFNSVIRREIFDDPEFPGLMPALRQAAALGERDKDYEVAKLAGGIETWLISAQTYFYDKARAAEETRRSRQDAMGTEPARLRLSLVFGAGIVAQMLIYVLSSGAGLGRLGFAFLFGLLGLMPGKNERDYELHFHLAYCFVVFAFMAFAQYKKEIMARVSESSLLASSLTFCYLCLSFLGGPRRELVLALAALPVAGTLIVAFTIREWSSATKLGCYIWFLVLAGANTAFQIRFGNLAFLFTLDYAAPPAFDLFMTGMAMTILFASLFYVYILIPVADKHETQEHRMARWREDAGEMVSRFSDYRLTADQAATIVLLQGGLYAANDYFGWLSPGIMMNVSIAILPLVFQLLFYRRTIGVPAQAENPTAR